MKKLILIAAILAATSARAECYSEGVRVGTIQKFSMKGFVTKSWEGELVMDGVKLKAGAEGGTRGGNVWAFSVDDAAVAKVIDNTVMSGNPVALRYCQNNPLNPLKGFSAQTSYRITQAVERK
jgi:hypothetical protein